MKTNPARRQDSNNPSLLRKQGDGFFHNPGSAFPVQAKLSVNTPGDAHEQEADAVADKVMRMPQAGNSSVLTGKEEEVQRMPDAREEDKMKTGATDTAPLMRKAIAEEDPMLTGERDATPQRRPVNGMADEEDRMRNGSVDMAPLMRKENAAGTGNTGGAVTSSFEKGLQGSKGGGSTLPDPLRRQMESGIGADFSNVRIHTGAHAAQLSRSIQAQAFTHGNDIYFNEGKYSPDSSSGKHLLAHELAHTVQQRAAPAIQRSFEPEDAVAEMIGKKFIINTALTLQDKTVVPANTEINISVWNNASHTVTGNVRLKKGAGTVTRSVVVDKQYLNTSYTAVSGIYGYKAGVKETQQKIAAGDAKLTKFKAGKPNYEKYNTMHIYNAEVANQERLQNNRYTDLNKKLIQETMFNTFDGEIMKAVDLYHGQIGQAKGWTKPDYNLVKSLIYQESSMGTAGTYLYATPRYEGDPMTRFNLTQSIDSSGSILTLMMNEADPALAARHKINDVTSDLNTDRKRFDTLKAKKRTPAEEKELAALKIRCAYDEPNNKAYWDYYYWSDPRFNAAWKEFNKQPTKQKTPGKMRNLDYNFWIQTGVRWLYKKRENVSSWEEAIRAFNGSGSDAIAYKKEVVGRRDAAKNGKNAYIPSH